MAKRTSMKSLLLVGLMARAAAQVTQEMSEYTSGSKTLNGRFVYQATSSTTPKPGLVLFPGPWGEGGGTSEIAAAVRYAEMGMVVFIADYFETADSDTNSEQLAVVVGAYGAYLTASATAQADAKAAYDHLLARSDPPLVNTNKVGALGFCFGGAMTLNLARSGAALEVAVSLHGEYPAGAATGTYDTKYFVQMVGERDPLIPATGGRDAWITELKGYTDSSATMDFDMQIWGGAYHAFSIRYSNEFLAIMAAGQGVPQITDGVQGVILYEQTRSDESFNRIDDLFDRFDLITLPTPAPTPNVYDLIEEVHAYENAAGDNLYGLFIYQDVPGNPRRPGLMVFPGPWGDGGGAAERAFARTYAHKGMVVFLPDYMGTNNSDTNTAELGEVVSAYPGYLAASTTAQQTALTSYEQLTAKDITDTTKIAAVGFCFGGANVLNLARAGAALELAMSFHGEYPALPAGGTANNVGTYNTKYFVEMVGVNDPLIPAASGRDSWINELKGYTDSSDTMSYDMEIYGSTVHAFSIQYTDEFLGVLAAGNNAQVVDHAIPGIAVYEPVREAESFNRLDDLLIEAGLLGNPNPGNANYAKRSNPSVALWLLVSAASTFCVSLIIW